MEINDRITEEEIMKWLQKLESVMNKIEVSDSKGEEMLRNVKAYVADSKHFLEKGEFVLSFECMVHGFAIFETCMEMGVFELSTDGDR